MPNPFIGEIRIFPFDFAPTGWASCDGQLLPVSQNPVLFSLLGTTYGGDGELTFALPDLRGRAAMHPGQGQGLSLRALGQVGGTEDVTLLASQVPLHTHALMASSEPGDNTVPLPAMALAVSTGGAVYVGGSPPLGSMAAQALPPAGGGLPHTNMQPSLTLNFCIAVQGSLPTAP